MNISSLDNGYIQAIVNFVNAYPILGSLTCIALAIASFYLAVKTFTAPKSNKRKVIDINARIENPSIFSECVASFVAYAFMLPIFVIKYSLIIVVELFVAIATPIIEIFVYFQVKLEKK